MGERAEAPPLPAIEALLTPPGETALFCRMRECNWLQALEGDVDTAHFTFLHVGKVEPDEVDPNHMERFQLIERSAQYHVRPTDWGAMYTAYRPANPGHFYYRFAHFVMPFWTLFPNGPFAGNILAQGWIPMDDTHTMVFTLMWKGATPPLQQKLDGLADPASGARKPDAAQHDRLVRPLAHRRKRGATTTSSTARCSARSASRGSAVSSRKDLAMTESMDPIADRTLEHLVPSDRMIVATRRRLYEAAWALQEHGTVPPLVDDPEASAAVRSGEVVAPADKDWLEIYEAEIAAARRPSLLSAAE